MVLPVTISFLNSWCGFGFELVQAGVYIIMIIIIDIIILNFDCKR
jgi:hypothetical protein